MKKTILAIAVPAMLAVSAAASAATVYKTDSQDLGIFGRALFKAHHNDNSYSDFSARLGVKGKTKVNDNLSAFFSSQWEMQSNRETLNSNTDSDDNNIQSRAIYVGLDYGDMGALKLGQDQSPFYSSLTVITDIFDFGGQESYEGTYGKNFDSNLAVYSNHMGPVTVQASYQFKTTSGSDDNSASAIDTIYKGTGGAATAPTYTSLEQSNAHSLAVAYDTGYNVNLRAAYARQNFAENTSDQLKDQTNYGFGVDYTMDNLYVAALYTHAKQSVAGGNDVKQNGYELAAKYNVGKISLLTGYAYGKQDRDGAADVKFAKSFKLGVQYHFTGDIKAIAGWVNNPHDGDQGKNPNTYSAGLQYNF